MTDPNAVRNFAARVHGRDTLHERSHLLRIMPSWYAWPHYLHRDLGSDALVRTCWPRLSGRYGK